MAEKKKTRKETQEIITSLTWSWKQQLNEAMQVGCSHEGETRNRVEESAVWQGNGQPQIARAEVSGLLDTEF